MTLPCLKTRVRYSFACDAEVRPQKSAPSFCFMTATLQGHLTVRVIQWNTITNECEAQRRKNKELLQGIVDLKQTKSKTEEIDFKDYVAVDVPEHFACGQTLHKH